MLNPLEMESFIQAVASRANMRVEWEKDVEQPRTDGKTIWLPHIRANITEEQYNTLKHYVVHEVDHVRFTDFDALKDQPTCQEGIFGAIINMVEDLRVEKMGAAEFLGDRLNSGTVQSKRLDEIGSMLKESLTKSGHPHEQMLKDGSTIMAWSHKHWSNIYPSVAGSSNLFDEAARSFSEGVARMDKLSAGDYDAVLKNLASSADALKLSERILKEVYDLDPEDERKKAKAQRKKSKGAKGDEEKDEPQEGEGEEGEGEAEGKGDKESKQGKGEDKEDKGKPSKRSDKERTWDYSDLMLDPHDKVGPSRAALHVKYKAGDFARRGAYSPAKKQDYTVHQRGGKAVDQSVNNGMLTWYDSTMKSLIRRTNPNFAHKVRTILQVRAKDRMQYGMKRGTLNQGALHRLMTDDPHNQSRIFKKRVTSDVLDSCVFLLVDQSGSMGGEKFAYAGVAAAMMNEVIGNVLHIPVMIASFTDHGRTVSGNGEQQHIHIHRSWKDQLLPNDKLLLSFAHAADEGMGNNADGDAIMWAYNQIAPHPAKRKLIIVFSDGSPAGGYRGDAPWYTKMVVERIEKTTPINIVGIGIQDDNVKHIYKDFQVIKKIDGLEKALLSTIEGKLK